jgi:signal transduction histidine kinase/ActR/RegA family two-component response regulator
MDRLRAVLSELWQSATTDLGRLWRDPPLSAEIRTRLAERAVRWVLLPSMCVTVFAALLLAATVGWQETTRFIPLLVFALPCIAVYRLKRAQRWIAAAAVFCTAATLSVVSGVLLHSVFAPAYDLGVLVLMLVTTLFGLRWAAAAALAIVGAGALWMTLAAHGLGTGITLPSTELAYGLRFGITLLALALVGGPHLLLAGALRDAHAEHERAEQASLAEVASAQAFHAVFDQASVAFALLTADGRITQLNARAQRLLDAGGASLAGTQFAGANRWSAPQRELLVEAVASAASGNASQLELTLPRVGASHGVYQVMLSPFHAADRCVAYVLVEIVDVSDVVETRSMLAQARRLEALGKLSGGVAHDLNNMFAAIVGGCEMVKIARGDQRKIDDHVALIQASVQRGATLTKQLLAFGRKDRWNSEQLDVTRILREVARLLERTLHKNIELTLSVSDEPCHVRADPAAIEHALLNLALNAQAAMPDGGTLTLACRGAELDEAACERLHGEVAPGPYVVLSVADTGTGMSAEVKERIFEPFFTTKPPGEGTGLGLAAVHGTMRAHHGAIWVDSQPGIGTHIELYLPSTKPLEARPPEREEIPVPTRIGARVLLADDEELARDAIAAMLRSAGCQVRAVKDGAALIDTLADGANPDVIITDLAMPGLSGSKLVQTLEAMRPDCLLVLISGYSGDDVAAACVTRDGRRLLRKPFSRADLLGTIAELLGRDQTGLIDVRKAIAL